MRHAAVATMCTLYCFALILRSVHLHPSDLSATYDSILVSFYVEVFSTHHGTSVWCGVLFSVALGAYTEL